ncbi:sensor histidine kinase [Streptomyces sp. NPDC050560]|uniref:sensor histidine kinase n=1 Tax=Streptomyces sp. NPDC050560 TaxID=3365630 RepID=UPI0037A30032
MRDPRGTTPREPGRPPEAPPPAGIALLPWLLLGMGVLVNLFQFQGGGHSPGYWGLGLVFFDSLYVFVVLRSVRESTREAPATRLALSLMTGVTCASAILLGDSALFFFPLLGLATGAAMRGRRLRSFATTVTALAATISCRHGLWSGLGIAYATAISTMVTAAMLSLSEAIGALRLARDELARHAVEEERLRFSRDLHDLLGHTMSVIVVKAEAARRFADRDPERSSTQVADIETISRQALTEIRQAVTGYRQGTLKTELDRARSALTAADTTAAVHRSGPPLVPEAEALFGWVVREATTNVIRHSNATHCEIALSATPHHARLTISDNGTPAAPRPPHTEGNGLTGLSERLTKAGGSLTTDRPPSGGFTVTAELPINPLGWSPPPRTTPTP